MTAVRAKTYDELLDDLVAAQGELENLRIRVAVGKELQDALRVERDAAQAEAAKYKALWDAVPWEALQVSVALSYMAPVTDNSYNLHASIWLEQNAPQEEA